jgi:hypothetical protein
MIDAGGDPKNRADPGSFARARMAGALRYRQRV